MGGSRVMCGRGLWCSWVLWWRCDGHGGVDSDGSAGRLVVAEVTWSAVAVRAVMTEAA